jgi:hypothetical protein
MSNVVFVETGLRTVTTSFFLCGFNKRIWGHVML